MTHHSEENRTKEEVELNIYSLENLISFTSHINNISSGIKALQRSISILKSELKIVIKLAYEEQKANRFKGEVIKK